MTEQTSKTALGKIFSKKPSFLFVVSKKAVNLHPVKTKKRCRYSSVGRATRRSPVQVWLAAQKERDAYASLFLFHRFFLPLPD